MAVDEVGNLDFSKDPENAYTIPERHVFLWGVRVWMAFDDSGELKTYWHVDGDQVNVADVVGHLELVKLSLSMQQLEAWYGGEEDDDSED